MAVGGIKLMQWFHREESCSLQFQWRYTFCCCSYVRVCIDESFTFMKRYIGQNNIFTSHYIFSLEMLLTTEKCDFRCLFFTFKAFLTFCLLCIQTQTKHRKFEHCCCCLNYRKPIFCVFCIYWSYIRCKYVVAAFC